MTQPEKEKPQEIGRTLYLDANVLDSLLDDPLREELVRRLTATYSVLVSMINVMEAVAAPRPRGGHLLDLISELVGDSWLLKEPKELLADCLAVLEAGTRTMPIEHKVHPKQLQSIYDRPEVQRLLEGQRQQNRERRLGTKQTRAEFLADLGAASIEIDGVRRESWARSPGHLIRHFLGQPEFLQRKLPQYVRDLGGTSRQVADATRLVMSQDLWCLVLLAHTVENYMSWVDVPRAKRRNPGFNDADQAIYLAVAGTVVTSDRMLRRLLRVVAIYRYGWNRRRILSFDALRAELLHES